MRFNPLKQRWVDVAPYLDENGLLVERILQDYDSDATAAEIVEEEARRANMLWQSAHDMETAAISGSAIGLVTIGIILNKPKAQAVHLWVQSIWDEYYMRKASGSYDTDFTVMGACPHTVPELLGEANG